MRPWLACLFACFALFAIAPVSRAGAETRLLAPVGVVRAGDEFEVRWAGLPEYAHEAELELSLDGGRWVRISPEVHSLEGSYRWRIPNSPAERAQVRLRCGGEHREEVAAVSAPFRIVSEALGLGRTDFLGEWWSALEEPGSRATCASALQSGAPSFSERVAQAAADAPSAYSLDVPTDDGQPLHAGAQLAKCQPRGRVRGARPGFFPLRN